jgi:23S rRNA U2552 (ribose-2'-O)-methylase RlmE/FtsJ
MAPGGFLKTVMALNPSATAMAFTLPRENGGHQVFLSPSSRVCIDYLDITMMAKDMGFDVIPDDHADKNNFISQQKVPAGRLFDLVLCDGQVLRTHTRANYREDREPRRLFTTQLVIGLEHLRPGGTMVVLLHMFDSWHTIQFLWTFQKFAQVQAFKPQTSHKTRSSFYMIAKNIQSHHPEAIRAVARWKSDWEIATFGNDEQFKSEVIMKDEIGVEEFLEEFGPAIVDMGAEVWRIQADALERAPWIKNA